MTVLLVDEHGLARKLTSDQIAELEFDLNLAETAIAEFESQKFTDLQLAKKVRESSAGWIIDSSLRNRASLIIAELGKKKHGLRAYTDLVSLMILIKQYVEQGRQLLAAQK